MINIIIKILTAFVGIMFFGMYIAIIEIYFTQGFLDIPFIFLTIYFFISTIVFPFLTQEAGEKVKDQPIFIRSRSAPITYLIGPIWIIIKIKNKGKGESE